MVEGATASIADGKFQVGMTGKRKTKTLLLPGKHGQTGIGLLQVRHRIRAGLPVGLIRGQMHIATRAIFTVTGNALAAGQRRQSQRIRQTQGTQLSLPFDR